MAWTGEIGCEISISGDGEWLARILNGTYARYAGCGSTVHMLSMKNEAEVRDVNDRAMTHIW